jgi:hypothetical protein
VGRFIGRQFTLEDLRRIGLALLVASVIAGTLWDAVGPQGTFLGGAAFTVLTLAGLLPVRGRLGGRARS